MKKSLSIIVLLSILLTSCGKAEVTVSEKKPLKSVKTVVLEKTPITEEVKLIGKVSADKEVTISAQISGIINAVIANVGDNVTKDGILATIDTNSQIGVSYQNSLTALNNQNNIYSYSKESIDKDIETAKLTLENAKNNKANIYSLSDNQLAISQKQLTNIQNNKSNTVLSNDENIKGATLGVTLSEESLKVAQSNINNYEKNATESKKTLLDKKISIIRNIVSNIQNSYLNIEQSLTFSDTLLGLTEKNKNLNDAYEVYLGAKNSSQKIKTEEELKTLLGNYEANIAYINNLNDKLANDIKNIDFYKSDSSYLNDLNSALDIISNTKKMLSDLNDVLNNSIVTTSLSQASIDGYKLNISQKQGAIIGSETSIISLKNGLLDINNSISGNLTGIDTSKVSLENALSIAKIQLENAKQNLLTLKSNIKLSNDNISGNVDLTKEQLNNTIATIKNSRDQADNGVKIAEAQLNSSIARLNSQLVQTKSQLDNSKGQTDLASVSLKNSVIKTPFSSIIVSKMVEVGSLVNPGTPLFTISSNDKIKIKVDMTIDNISSLTLGKEVRLELLNGNTSTGTISLVSKSPDPKTNLFQVEIVFDNNKLKSKIGEFVNVYISKNISDKKGIMLPFEAILNSSPGIYNVFVVSNSGTVSSREVTLGLKNGLNAEIVSGLKEKERIAISKVGELEEGDLIDLK